MKRTFSLLILVLVSLLLVNEYFEDRSPNTILPQTGPVIMVPTWDPLSPDSPLYPIPPLVPLVPKEQETAPTVVPDKEPPLMIPKPLDPKKLPGWDIA